MSTIESQYVRSLILDIGITYGIDWSPRMDKPRPYLTAALLCEKVLQENNGSVSLIRIADKLSYKSIGMPQGMTPVARIAGFIGLKSGPVIGEHVIKIIAENPLGKRQEVATFPVKFEGKDHGQNLIVHLNLGIENDGLCWFDVVIDDEVLTRIPLIVAREPS